ncbi:thiamine pyrophosphate-binding protein [Paenisporosarcina sp. OV554]|uniref:thiamine pyrophosphate-binding protein n=1 Tax=Paenisporosarcina sp. OV554 TaxID=2135694 RepID=UPI000D3D2A6D|nr:thiamine pyrophosphate-binding protein [Paenisporosarcina sp. OV554]PUB12902.1 acetolactate synthase-1/2/3 large subunit [Paenisporosarcina sp. OV554]
MKSIATILVEHLKSFQVTHAFGVPGKAIVPLLLAMEKNELDFVLSRHESGAGFMAGGYARQNNTLGVAIGTSGPGGTNLLTSAGQAKAYNLPILFITGHPSVKESGRAMGQDSSVFGTDLVKMFEPVTLFSARVDRADQFPLYFQHALETALTGRKGPVHLSIPADVLMEEIEPFTLTLPHLQQPVSPYMNEVKTLLDHAKKPLLFLGKGVHISQAYDEVKYLSLQYHIPVITTPGGKGTIRTDHPGYLGPFGLGGTQAASDYLNEGVDLLIVIGTKLTDMTLAGFTANMHPKQVIQFDIEPTFVGKSIPVPTLPIIGDAKVNLQAILDPAILEIAATSLVERESIVIPASPTEKISAVAAVKLMRKHLSAETILFGDDGSHTFYAIQHFDIEQEGTFFADDVFGTMGHAIGYAIGAKIAHPKQAIACLTGDGCMMMHGAEISVAVCHDLQIPFIVLNNGRLDMVDKGMRYNLGRSIGTVYEYPANLSLFGESLGAAAFRCFTAEEVEEALIFAQTYYGPTVIEIMVDPEEIPPTLKRG